MSKQEIPLEGLGDYLPAGALEPVLGYLHAYKIHLTITRARTTLLGDYKYQVGASYHRISVNGNLNPYAFLITLLHELAHLMTMVQHGYKTAPHGKEWKLIYGKLLEVFMLQKIFPSDIETALSGSLANPPASGCSDLPLMRVLRKYDKGKPHLCLIEELKEGTHFRIQDGRVFQIGSKVRKRYKAIELATGQTYLFSGIYEAEPVTVNG
ncbi:MAG: SprT-like domain-containing protein [Bacteroidetes bacterium]|nr:SprT-like domain-containing protein [Bacteroidota bacterium]